MMNPGLTSRGGRFACLAFGKSGAKQDTSWPLTSTGADVVFLQTWYYVCCLLFRHGDGLMQFLERVLLEYVARRARMSLNRKLVVPRWSWSCLIRCALLAASAATAWGQIIPSNRTANWSLAYVGVPGGIPHRTNIYTTLAAGASAATIQTAINNCPSNQVVLLAPGSYNVSSTLNFPFGRNGITLRGSGTNTVLHNTGSSYMISLGGGALWNTANYPPTWDAGVSITSGNTQGSSNLVVSSGAGMVVGQMVMVDENNDTNWVFDTGGGSAPRAMGQATVIQAISGNTITIWPPLLVNFNTGSDPRLKTLGSPTYQVQFSGIEDLVIDGSTTTAGTGMMIENCYSCWLSNVTFSLVANYHCTVYDSCRCSFSHCSFLDSPSHGPNHYGLGFEQRVCSSLVENCIMKSIFPGMEMNYGSSGNVVAYNFMFDSYQDNFGPGVTLDCNHGPHNVMNLFEGNVLSEFQSDGYFGSASHMTLLRNWVMGWGPTMGGGKAISLNRWSWYFNLVGNLAGTNGAQTEYEMTANGDSANPVYQFGYPNMGNNGYNGTAPPNTWNNPGSASSDNQWRDLLVRTNLIRSGNWDIINKAVVWDPSITNHTIPTSLYLSGKPSWFGSLAWPPFDPQTVSAAMLNATNIPAGYRFVYGVDPPASGQPAPPTNLRVVGIGP
jgi:hypothetical protein